MENHNLESEKVKIVAQQLREALNDDAFSLQQNVTYRKGTQISVIDIVVYHQNIPIAIVEVKNQLSANTEKGAKSQISRCLNVVPCKYGIVTDGETFHYFNNNTWITFSLDELVEKLKENIGKQPEKKIAEKIRPLLYENGLKIFYPSIIEDANGCRFDEATEELFWESIFDKKVTTIYRYTSLDSIFESIKNANIRMNGIVGMNDSSEISYFDEYCYRKKDPSYRILDNVYISSCTDLKDNLTMWRLYGDDAKGVCLEFEVKENFGGAFLLHSVSYPNNGEKDSNLEMIKKMMNLGFHFEHVDKWKYFFKARDYAVEEEIRLLYINDGKSDITIKKNWVKTHDTSIINPVIDFGIAESGFPLTLKTIFVGPKCPEKETNIEQLKELIASKNLGINVNVTSSRIKNYR